MSTLKVNEIANFAGSGAVEFTRGVSISGDKTITGNISLTGICTATIFVGSGIGVTHPNSISISKTIVTNLIT